MARRQRAPEARRHRPERWKHHEGGPGATGGGRMTKGTGRRKGEGRDKAIDKGKVKGKSKGKGQGKGKTDKDQLCIKEVKSNICLR